VEEPECAASQVRTSCSRNRHCLPILKPGSSRNSAQKQTVRQLTPSHFATASVLSRESGIDCTSQSGALQYYPTA
jgi:hypothetical protein